MQRTRDGGRRPGRWERAAGLLAALAAVFLAGWALFNAAVDPFGVFGDRLTGWWAYNETRNPRTAKFSYLERHHGEFDAYVLGGPAAGSWPKEALDRYFGASFYNLAMDNDDMRTAEQYARYLLEHYEVKRLVLTISPDSALAWGTADRSAAGAVPFQLDGGSALGHYLRYLFANPRYGVSKLLRMRTDGIVPNSFDVFDGATGGIDRSAQDVEALGAIGLEAYLAAHPAFSALPAVPALEGAQACLRSVAAIRDLCQEAGVELTVAAVPVWQEYLACFPRAETEAFFTALAETVPYWDFTSSSLSRDPRYFYDPASFRAYVGEMMLAQICGDPWVYRPEDFGTYVAGKGESVSPWETDAWAPAAYTAQVPILLYHHLGEEATPAATLEEHLAALKAAGYASVSFEDLRAYVERGTPLPDKPVVITFDDGYLSNLEVGLPLLARYGMQATIYVIGCSVGKDTYKDTGQPMTPHFSQAQARELMDSGWVAIGSHGYDFHEVKGRDPDPIRHGVLQREDESEAEYAAFLHEDCARFNRVMEEVLGHPADILAYPYGQCSVVSEILLAREGIYSTVTTQAGTNTLIKGLPQTLRAMNRYELDAMELTGEELLALLEAG